jgi:hypothetical protein
MKSLKIKFYSHTFQPIKIYIIQILIYKTEQGRLFFHLYNIPYNFISKHA